MCSAIGIRAILLDIEGTTTPIAFVTDVLVGYARAHLRSHIERHVDSTEFSALATRLRDEQVLDRQAGEPVPPWVDRPPAERLTSIIRYVEWLMDRDRKSTPLKALQGNIWAEGYRRGELAGEVFADVPEALARWNALDRTVAIFSSGSVLAQQLLFRYSSAGDLTTYLHWFFDTTTGAKSDSDSYRRIATAMAIPVSSVVFISDTTRELDAARSAGMQTRLSIRPGNPPATPTGHHAAIETLHELRISEP